MVNKKVENRFFMNKKAQEMSVTAIILIVLGIFVLVALILGFTVGWSKIKDFIIPSNNVATIKDSCKIACGTDQKYTYCFEKRELKSKDETLEDVTCYSLAKKKPVYGIETCSIDCGILDVKTLAEDSCEGKIDGTEVWYLDGTKVEKIVCGEVSE